MGYQTGKIIILLISGHGRMTSLSNGRCCELQPLLGLILPLLIGRKGTMNSTKFTTQKQPKTTVSLESYALYTLHLSQKSHRFPAPGPCPGGRLCPAPAHVALRGERAPHALGAAPGGAQKAGGATTGGEQPATIRGS